MSRYPFSPELLDALPEELAELFRGLEDALLVDICIRLKAADGFNEATVQDIKALRSHGISLDEIKKEINKTTGISEKKLDELLSDVVKRNQQYYTELIDIAGVTKPDVLVDIETIDAIKRQTLNEMRNITRTMAFVLDGGRTVLEPHKAFTWACDSAMLKVQSGAISYNQAIEDAVKQLADSGIRTVEYESGRRDHVDAAVRTAVMTGVNAINQKYAEQSMEYLGSDLVEVSAHVGARNIDGPNGWEAHSKWQGKVFRWNKQV